jgi:hypothetical protein
MPPQSMPSTESTVQGAVTDLLLADAALNALVPQGSIYGGEAVPEAQLPFVVVHGAEAEKRWIGTANRFEVTPLRVEVYAKQGATAAGQPNPAEAIAANVERVLNWRDLPIPNATPIPVRQKSHVLTEENRRAADKSRVFKVTMTWEVEIAY